VSTEPNKKGSQAYIVVIVKPDELVGVVGGLVAMIDPLVPGEKELVTF
jgi:hypothetical protein